MSSPKIALKHHQAKERGSRKPSEKTSSEEKSFGHDILVKFNKTFLSEGLHVYSPKVHYRHVNYFGDILSSVQKYQGSKLPQKLCIQNE